VSHFANAQPWEKDGPSLMAQLSPIKCFVYMEKKNVFRRKTLFYCDEEFFIEARKKL